MKNLFIILLSESEAVTTSGRRPMTPRRVKRRSVCSRGNVFHNNAGHTPHKFQQPNQLQYPDQPPPYVRRPSCTGTHSSGRSTLSRRYRTVSDSNFEQQKQSFHHQSN